MCKGWFTIWRPRSYVALCCVAQSYCEHAAVSYAHYATQHNARIDQKPILAYARASQRNARRKTLGHIMNQPSNTIHTCLSLHVPLTKPTVITINRGVCRKQFHKFCFCSQKLHLNYCKYLNES